MATEEAQLCRLPSGPAVALHHLLRAVAGAVGDPSLEEQRSGLAFELRQGGGNAARERPRARRVGGRRRRRGR
jgi:hypothetical protein